MNRSIRRRLLAAALASAACMAAPAADAPRVLKKVPPEFPAEAARRGVSEGVLKASLAIDGQGAVTQVTIVEATPAKAKVFNDAATDALKQWKFEPTGKAQTFELKLVFQQE
ncbi:MAG: energy transducer TonB [Pseudomonadota bacterium]